MRKALLLLAGSLTLLWAQAITPELREAVDAGLRAKQRGDLDGAVREFEKVVQLAPQMAAAHVNLGMVLYEKGELGRSIPALRRALELNAQLPGARLMLGTALLAQGYAAEAIPHFEQTQAMDLLGVALLEAGREREAIDRLEAALAARPGDADLLFYLGQAHSRLARQLVQRVRQEQSSARAAQLEGELQAAAGKTEAARKAYDEALRRRPDLREVHYALGELALAAGDYPTALKEFRLEAEAVPGSAAAAYKLGLVLQNMGDGPGALRELRRAHGLRADMPETLLELAKAEMAAGQVKEAEAHFRRVVELEPESLLAETAHLQLAQLYRKMQRTDEAERESKRFRELRSRRLP